MAVTRERALVIRNVLDNWIPPVLRDSKLLMWPLLRLAFGTRFRMFAEFKQRGFSMSPAEFSDIYARTADLQQIQGCTDLNHQSVEAILRAVVGESVLDAGCGRGYLVERLAAVAPSVVGCDIVLDRGLTDREGVRYRTESVERLSFPDAEFDTVISTHTLEHVQRIDRALAELRRVARRRLIVVVPRERPYRYSFNLHLHFFPHPWNWQAVAGVRAGSSLTDVGGDWLYVEDTTAYAGDSS